LKAKDKDFSLEGGLCFDQGGARGCVRLNGVEISPMCDKAAITTYPGMWALFWVIVLASKSAICAALNGRQST
jgi:hypothetical protein